MDSTSTQHAAPRERPPPEVLEAMLETPKKRPTPEVLEAIRARIAYLEDLVVRSVCPNGVFNPVHLRRTTLLTLWDWEKEKTEAHYTPSIRKLFTREVDYWMYVTWGRSAEAIVFEADRQNINTAYLTRELMWPTGKRLAYQVPVFRKGKFIGLKWVFHYQNGARITKYAFMLHRLALAVPGSTHPDRQIGLDWGVTVEDVINCYMLTFFKYRVGDDGWDIPLDYQVGPSYVRCDFGHLLAWQYWLDKVVGQLGLTLEQRYDLKQNMLYWSWQRQFDWAKRHIERTNPKASAEACAHGLATANLFAREMRLRVVLFPEDAALTSQGRTSRKRKRKQAEKDSSNKKAALEASDHTGRPASGDSDAQDGTPNINLQLEAPDSTSSKQAQGSQTPGGQEQVKQTQNSGDEQSKTAEAQQPESGAAASGPKTPTPERSLGQAHSSFTFNLPIRPSRRVQVEPAGPEPCRNIANMNIAFSRMKIE